MATWATVSFLITLAALAGGADAAQPSSSDARNAQWIYRTHAGDGSERPTAAFLSWNFGAVIFHVQCDPDTESLVFRHSDQESDSDATAQFVLRRGERAIEFESTSDHGALVGRVAVDPALLDVLRPRETQLEIEPVDAAGEPWYVGDAEPLFRVAEACRDPLR